MFTMTRKAQSRGNYPNYALAQCRTALLVIFTLRFVLLITIGNHEMAIDYKRGTLCQEPCAHRAVWVITAAKTGKLNTDLFALSCPVSIRGVLYRHEWAEITSVHLCAPVEVLCGQWKPFRACASYSGGNYFLSLAVFSVSFAVFLLVLFTGIATGGKRKTTASSLKRDRIVIVSCNTDKM